MASDNLELPGLSEPFEENETTTLCELCNGIISHHTGIGSETTVMPEFKLPEEETPTMLLILNGAQGGCRLCAVAWRVPKTSIKRQSLTQIPIIFLKRGGGNSVIHQSECVKELTKYAILHQYLTRLRRRTCKFIRGSKSLLGRAPILTLTTKNLEAFQQGLPISQLSKTFRDTVDVGKRLLRDFNVRYIWIDSLCIIQDSKPDWENEAPKMSQVYGNAFCCIAATSATDGSKGLFSPRNSMVEEVIRININRSRYPYLPSPVSITILNKDKWLQFIREAPLNQRGWVVQERALTKRALQFF
ncbi:heterokaryon incompatibility protein [Botrytis cinerea]